MSDLFIIILGLCLGLATFLLSVCILINFIGVKGQDNIFTYIFDLIILSPGSIGIIAAFSAGYIVIGLKVKNKSKC
jgi:hypothetical protein